MAAKQPNKGFLGKNKNRKSDKSPDYTGSILIGEDTLAQLMAEKASGKPTVIYLSGWKNTPQGGGDPYISVLCNAAQNRGTSTTQQSQQKPQGKKDEDIPF